MKDKEKIFEMLRAAAETPLEEAAVEDFINKVDGDGLKIEQIDETHQRFNGIVYGKTKNKNGHYFKIILLHRAVWTYYYGEIPVGYVVHHIDGNPSNNDISNLTIMTKSEHLKLHACLRNNFFRNNVIARMPTKKTFKCIVCGKEYEGVNNGHNLYCSKKCRDQRKKTQQYVDIRKCLFCGKDFVVYKYHATKFCCLKCASAYRSQQGRVIKVCPICGKSFSSSKSTNQKYCSQKCAYKRWDHK